MRKTNHKFYPFGLRVMAAALCFVVVVNIASKHVGISIDHTGSTGYEIFFVLKGKTPSKGQYALVTADENLKDYQFYIKQVGGVAQDEIEIKNCPCKKNIILINGEHVCSALKANSKGEKLNTINPGYIPDGHYFLFNKSARSFDSRYQEFGLVNENRIFATAVPLL